MPGSPHDPSPARARPSGDDIHAQGARLLAYLKANGITSCAELAAACDVPSVTKRICELIGAGWPITRTRGHVRTRSGGMRRATFYDLIEAHAQGDLFGSP
jgi:hypothetical protein